jgi:hypothetical protein
MRRSMRALAWVVAVGLGVAGGCSAAGTSSGGNLGAGGDDGTGGSSQGGASHAGGAASGGSGIGTDGGAGGVAPSPDASCADFTAGAKQASAAMLFVLDMTASMTGAKWAAAQQAVAAAIDQDAFDGLTLGLVTFPVSTVQGPDCVFGFSVTCGTSGLPQVALGPTGKDKSNAPAGVRHDIYQYLVNHGPISAQDDGSPVYDALSSAYSALKLAQADVRIAVLVTDGGFSCTSLSNRPGYTDLNGCPDWEEPDAMNALVKGAHDDPSKPIHTFVVGVPGSDSTGQKQGAFDTPPYHMRLALSTYAVSGSPETIDPACSKDAVFSQGGADPAVPCHIDLSQGQLDPAKLGGAIQAIRGQALGCVFSLPDAPRGKTIDKDKVNVFVTLEGATSFVPRRKDPKDDCVAAGCWDYDADGKVDLVGKSCKDVVAAADAKVDIEVGCDTVLK